MISNIANRLESRREKEQHPRYDDFRTITRSHSQSATSDPDEIVRRAIELLEKTEAGRRPVRLLGAGVHNLERPVGQEGAEEVETPQLRFE